MTYDQWKQLYEIERHRQFEKEEMILLLLMLFWWCERDALAAFASGDNPVSAIQNRIVGHPGAPGAFGGLNRILQNGYADAFRRGVVAGNRIVGSVPTLPGGRTMNDVLNGPVPPQTTPAGNVAQIENGLLNRVKKATTPEEIKTAFHVSGVTKDHPYLLDTIAITEVNAGMQPGLMTAWLYSPRVTGFLYCAVLDARTTPICTAYDGVQLPKTHWWWKTHWPSNHWRCRSTILPLFGAFEATPNPPLVPAPMPGFGIAPAHVINLFRAA